MAAINCDDPLARCELGNLFRVDSSVPFSFEGRVNGMGTGALPMGQRMILPNTLPGTANSLEVVLNGTTYPICSNVQDFRLTRPQELGVLLSEVPVDGAGGPGRMEQELMVMQVASALTGSIPEGEIDPDTADNGLLLQVAVAILVGMEVIDATTGAQALFNHTGGDIDLRVTGTDGPPALADAIAAVRSADGRRAVRAIVDGGKGALRVARNGVGALIIIARMKPGLTRAFVGGVAVSLTRNRMAHVITGTKGQLGAASVGSGVVSKIPVVGWLIVGTIDVVEWYGNPESRGDWSLLFSTLIVDGAALFVSVVAASAAAGLAAAAFGAALTVGAALAVLAVGIGVGVLVGMLLTWVANRTDLVQRLDQALSWAADGLTALGQGAVEVTSSFADRMGQRYEQARDWAGEKLEQAGEGLQDAGRWTKDRASEAADWTVEKAGEVSDWASQTADDIGEWTGDRATDVGNWADRQARDVREGWNALRERAGTAWEGVF